jgi:hypothetical protein
MGSARAASRTRKKKRALRTQPAEAAYRRGGLARLAAFRGCGSLSLRSTGRDTDSKRDDFRPRPSETVCVRLELVFSCPTCAATAQTSKRRSRGRLLLPECAEPRVRGLTRALPNTRRVGPVAYDPDSRSSVSVAQGQANSPGPTSTLRGTGGLRGDYSVWPCSSRGHDSSAAGVDCGRRQPRSLRRARRPTSPCRSRERVARERVPSASGAGSARPANAAAYDFPMAPMIWKK